MIEVSMITYSMTTNYVLLFFVFCLELKLRLPIVPDLVENILTFGV